MRVFRKVLKNKNFFSRFFLKGKYLTDKKKTISKFMSMMSIKLNRFTVNDWPVIENPI